MDDDRRPLRRFGWVQTFLGPAYLAASLVLCPVEDAADLLRRLSVAAALSAGGLLVLYRARSGD
ncbi:MAG TPA: hypothetical protein VF170_08700 [Planctomycetaceae bacterium]